MNKHTKWLIALAVVAIIFGWTYVTRTWHMPPEVPMCEEDEYIEWKTYPYEDASDLECRNVESLVDSYMEGQD